MLSKFLITPLKKRFAAMPIPFDEAEEWARMWKFFFILGFGRSGTAFLADLLNQASGAYVFHEPVIEDFYAHLQAHRNPRSAETYMRTFRIKDAYLRMRSVRPGVYGEVTSTLRCHAEAIKSLLPQATLIHLVRDGRDVIRSAIVRKVMTLADPLSLQVRPARTDPWHAQWHKMDRFARLCWYWQEENRRIRATTGKTVQFEELLTSYECFRAEVLEPCQIDLDKETWQTAIGSPKNITAKHRMPKWEGWTPDQQTTFREICGAEMAQCGYAL